MNGVGQDIPTYDLCAFAALEPGRRPSSVGFISLGNFFA